MKSSSWTGGGAPGRDGPRGGGPAPENSGRNPPVPLVPGDATCPRQPGPGAQAASPPRPVCPSWRRPPRGREARPAARRVRGPRQPRGSAAPPCGPRPPCRTGPALCAFGDACVVSRRSLWKDHEARVPPLRCPHRICSFHVGGTSPCRQAGRGLKQNLKLFVA